MRKTLIGLFRDKGVVRDRKVEELLRTPSTHQFIVRGLIKDLTDAEVDACAKRENRISVLRILNSEQRIRDRHPRTMVKETGRMFDPMSDEEYRRISEGLIYEKYL